MEYLYSLSVALFLTIALIPLLIRVSGRLGLVDAPTSERKVHAVTMPRTGGLGIIVGAILPLLFLLPFEGPVPYLFAGGGIIVFFGLLDDRVELNYKWKLFGQALAAIVVMCGGISVHQLPFFGLGDGPVWLSYPLTFFFLVGVVNGVNFSDGLDGLAAGTTIMALLLIFVLALPAGNIQVALVSITLVGAVGGFLRYNTFPANIFMGDAGSQFLGFMTACLAIMVTQGDTSPYSPFLPVLILGIPIMDILQVVPVRIHKKLPLPGPDKEHFHHQIGKLGFRHVEVVAIIYVLQTVLMSAAFALRYYPDYVAALSYSNFLVLVLGALLLGNFRHWKFRSAQRESTLEERRNRYLRRLEWYYRNSPRCIAIMLGVFLLSAGLLMSGGGHLVLSMGVLVATLAVLLYATRWAYLRWVFRLVLYCASALIAYTLVDAPISDEQMYGLLGYLGFMIVCLMLAIRMTRKQEFRLTTQDLLIALVVVLVPLLPFDMVDRYAIGRIALLVAVLMYTSEFVLNRATRAVAFSCACAVAGVSVLL